MGSSDRRTGSHSNATGIKARPKGAVRERRLEGACRRVRAPGHGGRATPLLSFVTTAAPSRAGQAASVVNVVSSFVVEGYRRAAVLAVREGRRRRVIVAVVSPRWVVSSSRRHVCARDKEIDVRIVSIMLLRWVVLRREGKRGWWDMGQVIGWSSRVWSGV